MVARIVLRVFAVLALLIGAALTAVHLGGWDVTLPPDTHEWGLLPGLVVLAVWCGGLSFTWDHVQRLRQAALGSVLGLVAGMGIGHGVSLLAEESARADVKIGVHGALQVIVAVFVLCAAAKSRWPSLDAG